MYTSDLAFTIRPVYFVLDELQYPINHIPGREDIEKGSSFCHKVWNLYVDKAIPIISTMLILMVAKFLGLKYF